MQRKAVVAGGTGFLGSRLTDALKDAGWRVVCLSRRPAPGGVEWDGKTPGRWREELDGAEVLVNFSGRSIACVHTPENRRAILASRIDATRALSAAVAAVGKPPRLWIQASSLAYYGNPGDRRCDESTPPEPADLPTTEVTREWERVFFDGDCAARRVAARIGLILDGERGGLVPLARLTRHFLGGAAGSGRQYISWMHAADFVAACQHVMGHPPPADAGWNFCAPNPATNAEFMGELRRVLHRPWAPPAPAAVVRLAARWLLRTDASLALTGCRGVPRALAESGFRFQHPWLREGLEAIAAEWKRPPAASAS